MKVDFPAAPSRMTERALNEPGPVAMPEGSSSTACSSALLSCGASVAARCSKTALTVTASRSLSSHLRDTTQDTLPVSAATNASASKYSGSCAVTSALTAGLTGSFLNTFKTLASTRSRNAASIWEPLAVLPAAP